MSQFNVADLVANDAQQLLVVHQIHESGIDANRAVCCGIGVHTGVKNGFEVEFEAVFVGVTAGQASQARAIFIATAGDFDLGGLVLTVLQRAALDFSIGDRGCFGQIHGRRRC